MTLEVRGKLGGDGVGRRSAIGGGEAFAPTSSRGVAASRL